MSFCCIDHPLVHHDVTRLRDQATGSTEFRRLAHRVSTLLVLEATRDLPMRSVSVQTPLETANGSELARGCVAVPVLRAGLGMLQAAMDLLPDVSVGYLGLERDHETAVAASYYCKLPSLAEKTILLLDPMLATGGSACQAIAALKNAGGSDIRLLCIVAAPEGVQRVQSEHSDTKIFAAARDRVLNDLKYILPGLGDFGDRLFGT